MYTTLTGSNPPTLMLGELRRFISLFLTNWNKLSNILHVFLIVMTMQQTLLTYSLHLTHRTILTLSPLLWDPLTIVLFQLLQLLLHHHLSLPLSVIFGTLRTPRRADMSNFLFDFPWEDYCFRTRDPDLAVTAVGEVMDSGMRAYIPYSLITFSPSKPWFDRACSSAISDREGAHRSYQASPSELTHATFISARNRCSAKLRRACSSFRKRKIDKLNSSPTEKCFWSLSKKIFNNFCNSSFPSLIRPDGSIACSPTDKANLFRSYFSANSSLSDSNAPDPPTQPLSNPIPSIIISARKVRRVLRSLKTDKASGPDGIPPRFLKEFADELAPVLCRLFRLILISCTYPFSWKHALIQPVPKKGDRSNPSNYRPIALTSAVAKVFETLLNSHFIKHL